MISHVSVCLLTYGENSSISNTFRHTKREYSFSVRPICCTPVFLFTLKILRGVIIERTATRLSNRLADDPVVDAACQKENQQIDQGEYPCHNSKSNHVVGHIAHAKEDQNV